jgi:hypothetical protein
LNEVVADGAALPLLLFQHRGQGAKSTEFTEKDLRIRNKDNAETQRSAEKTKIGKGKEGRVG